MQESQFKIYEIEYEGKVYEIEASADVAEEDLFSAIEGYTPEEATYEEPTQEPVRQPSVSWGVGSSSVPAAANPPAEQKLPGTAGRHPLAIPDSVPETSLTKSLKRDPQASADVERLIRTGVPFSKARKELEEKYPYADFASDGWGRHYESARQYYNTPDGRKYYANKPLSAGVFVPTGVEDEEAPDGVVDEFFTSSKRSLATTANTVTGLGALGADLVGADETAEALLDTYLEKQAAIGQEYKTGASNLTDSEDFGDVAMWGASVLGELVPEITGSVGVGYAGKLAAEKVAKRGIQEFVEDRVEAGMTREAAEQLAKQAVEKKAQRGAVAAAGSYSVGQSSGQIYGDTYGETGERAPWRSLLAGTAAGALDTLLPASVLNKIGGAQAQDVIVEGLVRRYGKAAVGGFLKEGGTEAIQTIIEGLPASSITGDWSIDGEQVLEAFFRGGFGGSVVAGTTQSVVDNIGTVDPSRSQFPTEATIVVPTAKPRTKAYKEQIGVAQDQVVEVVNKLADGWTNSPEVEVHQNFKNKNVDDNAIGVYTSDGKVLINTEAVIKNAERRGITPDEMVAGVVFHEALGHGGLAKQYGEQLDTVLDDIYTNGTREFQQKVEDWLAKNPKAYEETGEQTQLLRATEEVLAEWSEKEGVLPAGITDKLIDFVKQFARKLGINIKYSSQEVRGILGMSQKAVTKGSKTETVLTDNTDRYMQAGRRAMTANNLTRDEAVRLERQGVSQEEIRKKTGWHRGPDGMHRFEINDALRAEKILDGSMSNKIAEEFDLNGSNISATYSGESLFRLLGQESWREDGLPTYAKLEDLIDHPDLFKAYPSLRNVTVSRENKKRKTSLQGSFSPSNKTIWISPYAEDPEGTLYHEIQHWVQEHEDFARGGTPSVAPGLMDDDLTLKVAEKYIKYLNDLRETETDESYANSLFSFIQSFRKLVRTGDTEAIRNYLSTDGNVSHQAYEHLFGEVEARDTANRLNLSAEERAATKPYTSEDFVEPEDYIYKYMRPEDVGEDTLTAEDLVETKNAYEVLEKISRNYTPTTISPENIEQEAVLRGVRPSDVTRWVGKNPGDLVRRLFMYDIAAEKLNTRLLNLQEKIETNGLDEETQANYIKTLVRLEDLTNKIFTEQSELGRALGAIRHINYTRKRVSNLKDALAEYDLEALADPETFYKLMAEISQQQKDNAAKAAKGNSKIISALNVPRAVMSSMDLSAPMRQGIVFVGTANYWRSFFKMFTFLGRSGEANYAQLMRDIAQRETYELMQKARLSFSDLDGKLSSREEDFQSDYAKKIPLIGRGIKMSEQAYAGFLNKLRADMFDQFVYKYQDAGVELDENLLKSLGSFISSATGRAELPGGLKSMAPQLNTALFSPRLIQSRFNMLNPYWYYKLPAPVRKEAVKSMVSFGVIASLFVGALALMFPDEVEVELDPRSSDFGKVKVGNTRFDVAGGFLQYVTLGAKTLAWATGQEAVKTSSGDLRKLKPGMNTRTYGEEVLTFFRNKLSPNASFVVDAAFETNAIGEPVTLESSVTSRIVPMYFQSVHEAAEEYGPTKGLAVSVPGLFGIGVNTYVPKSLDPEQELEAPESFKMEELDDGENEMIKAEGGEVSLKPLAREMWEQTINNYFQLYIKQDLAETGKEWDQLTPEEQRDLIEVAEKDARYDAKKDMLYELGLD